jgi:6-phosphofructokinase 1
MYRCATGLAELEKVANTERLVPQEWISESGNDVMPAFRAYAGPLAGEIDSYERLDDMRVRAVQV